MGLFLTAWRGSRGGGAQESLMPAQPDRYFDEARPELALMIGIFLLLKQILDSKSQINYYLQLTVIILISC
jgi:hypothetical protein